MCFCVAGDSDPVVNIGFGEMTNKVLGSFCSKLKFNKYPGLAHSSSPHVSSDKIYIVIVTVFNRHVYPTFS